MGKKRFFKKNKLFIALTVLALLCVLIFMGFKLFLYVKYLIGNDLVIQLETDNRDLSLVWGQNKTINFEMSKVTSPLCKTKCESFFSDISRNITLSQDNFIFDEASQNKEETIFQDRTGSGQAIYSYSLVCSNVKNFLCHTSELPISRKVLITVEYGPNQEQINTQKSLAQRIYDSFNQTSIISSYIEYMKTKLDQINETLLIEEDYSNLTLLSDKINDDFLRIATLWKQGRFDKANETFYAITADREKLRSDFLDLNRTVYSKVEQYNYLVKVLSSYGANLTELSSRGMNQSDSLILDRDIADFNSKIDLFSRSPRIQDKADIAFSILKNSLLVANCSAGRNNTSDSNGSEMAEGLYNGTVEDCSFKAKNVVNFNLSRIEIISPNQTYQNFTLQDPLPECCAYNKCKPCGKVEGAYPILFIHGHDFNKDISAEYSLNAFEDIQSKLNSDGFLNAGQVTLYDVDSNYSGRLGYAGIPMTFRSTYYYDVLKESSSIYLPVQVKSENIDTYSIKLRTLVEKLKYETGQPKVIIVAHSMGGLVARRYIQLFGNESVDKLILIATPNQGITGDIVSLCSVFGAKAECNDLTSGSLFLNKLNNYPSSPVKTYNVIGTGCEMGGEDGDGIVLKRNAVLNSAQTYYVNGSCLGINFLHNELLRIDKYPSVYETIKDIFNISSEKSDLMSIHF